MSNAKKLILFIPLILLAVFVYLATGDMNSALVYLAVAGGILLCLIVASVIYEAICQPQNGKAKGEDAEWERMRKNIL